MNIQWIKQKTRELEERRSLYPQRLLDIWDAMPKGYCYLLSHTVELTMRIIALSIKHNEPIVIQDILTLKSALENKKTMAHYIFDRDKEFFENKCQLDRDQFDRFLDRLVSAANEYYYYLTHDNPYTVIQDSTPIQLDGDIIITEPNMLLKIPTGRIELSDDFNDWNIRGISYCSSRKVWGFKDYDTNHQTIIHEFETMDGQICAVQLDDVLKLNPSFDLHIKNPAACIYIKNFHGTAQIKLIPEIHKKEHYVGNVYICVLDVNGVDETTGAEITFTTRMGSLNE